MAFVRLIALKQCNRNAGTFVPFGDYELAVFRQSKGMPVVVLDNSCPHAAGNLSGGEVDDGVVRCPWHHWEFKLTTGVCTHSDKARVKAYRAEVRDGAVWVDLPS